MDAFGSSYPSATQQASFKYASNIIDITRSTINSWRRTMQNNECCCESCAYVGQLESLDKISVPKQRFVRYLAVEKVAVRFVDVLLARNEGLFGAEYGGRLLQYVTPQRMARMESLRAEVSWHERTVVQSDDLTAMRPHSEERQECRLSSLGVALALTCMTFCSSRRASAVFIDPSCQRN